jgi:hypothetical protein
MRHGLFADGIVGEKTLKAMNVFLKTLEKVETLEPAYDVALLKRGGKFDESKEQQAWKKAGLEPLILYIGDETFTVVSGAPGCQNFRMPDDKLSVPGNLEPLPHGRYESLVIEMYEVPRKGIGKYFTPLRALFKDDRGAFGVHLDENLLKGSPGSAGCVVACTGEQLTAMKAAWKKFNIRYLNVLWF